MKFRLGKNNRIKREGPLLLIIMDGVGEGPENLGNAVHLAQTPNLDYLKKNWPWTILKAHGTAVGMPSDGDMGNSEVGHNAMGAGRVYAQGAKLVESSMNSGEIFKGETWNWLTESPRAMHFMGLLSDGNVHSHINHLIKMIEQADRQGIENVFVHILLDGRDVPETSALIFVEKLESTLEIINNKGNRNYRIASGGGRMYITMDRYQADWSMVERGWRCHVEGVGRRFGSATEAIETYRNEYPGIIDQDLKEFVIEEEGHPVGNILDGDSVIFFNFRGDRAIEISRTFEEEHFDRFERALPKIRYAGMMEYDGDLHIPKRYLVSPPRIEDTIGEILAENKISQLAISETQKYGHTTYFWNGNRSGKFSQEYETYIEIPSDIISFNKKPQMKAIEITHRLIQEIKSGKYRFLRINYPNGDMVGHTGDLKATIKAVETVDNCLGRLLDIIEEMKGIAVITADHGNSDEMYIMDKKTGKPKRDGNGKPLAKTAHTLNPVPFIIYDPEYNGEYVIKEKDDLGLANLAATLTELLGYVPPEHFQESIIRLK